MRKFKNSIDSTGNQDPGTLVTVGGLNSKYNVKADADDDFDIQCPKACGQGGRYAAIGCFKIIIRNRQYRRPPESLSCRSRGDNTGNSTAKSQTSQIRFG